eukprot:3022477-Rhodomonas_salina.1
MEENKSNKSTELRPRRSTLVQTVESKVYEWERVELGGGDGAHSVDRLKQAETTAFSHLGSTKRTESAIYHL